MQVFVWRPERNFLERVFSFQSIESGSLIISAITQDSRALKSALSSLFCLHLKYFNRTLELWPHSAFGGFQELDLGPQECAEGILTHGVLLPTPPPKASCLTSVPSFLCVWIWEHRCMRCHLNHQAHITLTCSNNFTGSLGYRALPSSSLPSCLAASVQTCYLYGSQLGQAVPVSQSLRPCVFPEE